MHVGFAVHDVGFAVHDVGFVVHDVGFAVHDVGLLLLSGYPGGSPARWLPAVHAGHSSRREVHRNALQPPRFSLQTRAWIVILLVHDAVQTSPQKHCSTCDRRAHALYKACAPRNTLPTHTTQRTRLHLRGRATRATGGVTRCISYRDGGAGHQLRGRRSGVLPGPVVLALATAARAAPVVERHGDRHHVVRRPSARVGAPARMRVSNPASARVRARAPQRTQRHRPRPLRATPLPLATPV